MNLIDLFNLAVYIQPFLFLKLYRYKDYQLIDYEPLYVLGLSAAFFIVFTELRISHYSADILAQYILMVIFVVYVNRRLPGAAPLSMACLIVFMNSWIWEFPIHIADFYENFNVGLQVIQALHLTPLLFYSRITGINWRQAFVKNIDLFLLSWLFTLACTWLRFTYPQPFDNYFMHLNRYASLIVCLKTFSAYDPTVSGEYL